MNAALSGFLLGLSLILAIGAQNAFVLRQGLRREHVFAVCTICAGSDAILIAAGVGGFGVLVTQVSWLNLLMRFGGAIFLFFYALRSFWSACYHKTALNPAEDVRKSLKASLLTCLAFTWLNPHVYLDTVLLIGSVSSHYVNQRISFAAGAILASFLFFFTLGYGARLLKPLFANPHAWRVLDGIIGTTMLVLAAKLTIQG